MRIKRSADRVRTEAAEWLIASAEHELDSSSRQSFDRWLRASPQHVRAFLRASALWESADLLVGGSHTDVSERTRRALSASCERTSPPLWPKIAACLLLAVAISAGIIRWQQSPTSIYETRAGELRTVRLSDGSTVQINARSRVEVHFTERERAVDLIEGEALFSVAKDATRAFGVRSHSARINAVGTQFNVYQKSVATLVTVVEGSVSVRGPKDSNATAVFVSAGEQTVASLGGVERAYPTNISAATAWTEGKLEFQSTPLEEVVAEFNRVGLRRLVIDDNTIMSLHLSGVFPAEDPSSFVEFLRARFGLTVEETDEELRVSRGPGSN